MSLHACGTYRSSVPVLQSHSNSCANHNISRNQFGWQGFLGRAYHKPDARSAGHPACNRSLRHHFAGKVPRTRSADLARSKKDRSKKFTCTVTLSRLTSLPSVLTWFDHGSRWVKRLRRLPGVTAGRMVGSTLGRVCSPRFPSRSSRFVSIFRSKLLLSRPVAPRGIVSASCTSSIIRWPSSSRSSRCC